MIKLFKPIFIFYSTLDFFLFFISKFRLPFGYRVFRKTCAWTGGKWNNFINKFILFEKSKFIEDDLMKLTNLHLGIKIESESFLKNMNKNGFHIFKTKLSVEKLNNLRTCLSDIPSFYLDKHSGKYVLVNSNDPSKLSNRIQKQTKLRTCMPDSPTCFNCSCNCCRDWIK